MRITHIVLCCELFEIHFCALFPLLLQIHLFYSA